MARIAYTATTACMVRSVLIHEVGTCTWIVLRCLGFKAFWELYSGLQV